MSRSTDHEVRPGINPGRPGFIPGRIPTSRSTAHAFTPFRLSGTRKLGGQASPGATLGKAVPKIDALQNMRVLGIFIILVVMTWVSMTDIAFAQFDYYDPYSNSNIDRFPSNPINTSPRRTNRDTGTSGNTPARSTTPTPKSTPEKTPTSTPCANRPTPNPTNTRSVEIRDASGIVFYLSPPKEEVLNTRAYPETSQKIFALILDDAGTQKDEEEIGLITVDNACYPKYGYIRHARPSPTPVPSPRTDIPPDKTAVTLDPITGNVYNKKTGERIPDARYESTEQKIYYKDTQSTFGKVFTETTGYVNIHTIEALSPVPSPTPIPTRPSFTKACSKKITPQFSEEQPYHFCYRSDTILVSAHREENIADFKKISPSGPTSVFTITYYINDLTINDVMKDWYHVQKKKVENKFHVSGFTYILRDSDGSARRRYGALLINTKSGGREFVHIQFPRKVDRSSKPFRIPQEFKTLIKTFRFL